MRETHVNVWRSVAISTWLCFSASAGATCGSEFTRHNQIFTFNLSALESPHDYELDLTERQGKIALNFCRPPLTSCNEKGNLFTPSALEIWGDDPLIPCTTASGCHRCKRLGWGALGAQGAHWSLVDPAAPHVGVRLTHYGFGDAALSACGALSGSSAQSLPPPIDEWGAPRPSSFTVDLMCDPNAPWPAAPLEAITLANQQPGDSHDQGALSSGVPVYAVGR